MKKCPLCAEKIQEDAILCKHCGANLKELEYRNHKEKRRKVFLEKKERESIQKKKLLITFFVIFLNFVAFSISVILGYLMLILVIWGLTVLYSKESRKDVLIHLSDYKFSIFLTVVSGAIAMTESLSIGGAILLGIIWLYSDKKENSIKKRILNFKFYKARIVLSVVVVVLVSVIGITQYIAIKEQIKQQENNEELEEYGEKKKEGKDDFLKNYPNPEILILSDQTNQGDKIEYLLEFTVKNTETVLVNSKEVKATENGNFKQKIELHSPETAIHIMAKNTHKTERKNIIITRNETKQEKERGEEQERKQKIETSPIATIERIINKTGDYEITIWTLDGNFANADSEPPYEIIVNTSASQIQGCFDAKSKLFNIMKSAYTNNQVKNKIVRIKFTAWGELKASLGSNDAVALKWDDIGISNFWTVFQEYKSYEDESNPISQRTYGVPINNNCK